MRTISYPKKQIAVAMSGGVDSSVAVALLVQAGYEVIGISLKLYSGHLEDEHTQTGIDHAKEIADYFGVQHITLDVRKIFTHEVIGEYISALKSGITPNPCLLCNRLIKWGFLFDYIHSLGITDLASGHYAQIMRIENGEEVFLYQGVDEKKDQSYILSVLPQKKLQSIHLPVGIYSKKQIYHLAKDFGITEKVDKESQDLCFLNKQSQSEFLTRYHKDILIRGEIIDTKGTVIGRHKGLPLYTIGQRKGISIASNEPFYVLSKEVEKNRIIVGKKDESLKYGLIANSANWINHIPEPSKRYAVKIRYRATPKYAKIFLISSNEFVVQFEEGLTDITPGQQVVIYDDKLCIGSGQIIISLE